MEKYQCLVCGREMQQHHKIKFIDYSCVRDDHHFSWRIVEEWDPVNYTKMNTKMAKLRVRVGEGKNRMCIKIHYDDGYTEVWSTPKSSRIRIDQIIPLDFKDIEKLKNKIRTILVFA